MKKWNREIAEAKDWTTIRDGVEVKLCLGPQGNEIFLLCRSAERREKEKAKHERFSARIEERLRSLTRRIEHARSPLDRGPIERQLGRIQSADVVLPLADGSGREVRLRCVVRPDKIQAALLDRLGLRLLERLRIPSAVARM